VLLAGIDARALPTTSIVVQYTAESPSDPVPPLADANGIALDAGSPADGDGSAVALGYFTSATPENPFAGLWVPLTGPSARNTGSENTSVGDSGSSIAGPFGFFAFQADFDAGSENYTRFADTPPADAILAVAIYDTRTLGPETRFGLASNPAWRWRNPSILPDLHLVDLRHPDTVWYGGDRQAGRASLPLASFPGLPSPDARLVNISTRGFVGTGAAVLIPGFVLAGDEAGRVLVRAVGPFLAEAIAGTLDDPRFTLFAGDPPQPVAANDDWSLAASVSELDVVTMRVGASPFLSNSSDAAEIVNLGSGSYTAAISGTDGSSGIGLAEVYLDESAAPVRILNLSTRGFVGTGDSILIPGFVVQGSSPLRLLVRAVGPTLAAEHGVDGALARARLVVFDTAGNPVASNDGWDKNGEGARIAAAGTAAGAQALSPGAADAALIFVAAPGAYTAHVTGADGGTGIALFELYVLP
jgi:hypothetical protein